VEQFAEVMSSERVLEALQVFAPKTGDAVHLPPGTVHTIGPDVVVFEIQRNSDVTYRLFDWGRARELHTDKGLAAVRFDRQPETTVVPEPHPDGGAWLVRDPHFCVRRLPLPAPSLSEGLTLEPGDVIATGTPSGVGYAMDPPSFLKDGDVVICEIDGIGRLENRMTTAR
jgi:hypothetical protein